MNIQSEINKEKELQEIRKKALTNFFNFNKPPENLNDIKKWHEYLGVSLKLFNPDPNSSIREIICDRSKEVKEENYILYYPECFTFSEVKELIPGNYTTIVVSLNDIISKVEKDYLDKEYYFCSMTTPSWTDPLMLSYRTTGEYITSDGDISCYNFKFSKDVFNVFLWLGRVPLNAKQISLRIYLIDKQLFENVIGEQKMSSSFKEILNLLENQKLIYQRILPVLIKK
ncbi:MAG: hypothetical protein ABIK76_06225 [candidate division WOR-3 bacterium]